MCVAKGHGPASRHRPPSPRLLLLREVSRATHTGRRASWLAHGPSCGHWARTLVGYLAVSRVKSSLRGAAVSVSEKGGHHARACVRKQDDFRVVHAAKERTWGERRGAQGRGLGEEESAAGRPGERARQGAARADPGVRDEPAESGELLAGCGVWLRGKGWPEGVGPHGLRASGDFCLRNSKAFVY